MNLYERAAAAVLRRLSHPPRPYHASRPAADWSPEGAVELYRRTCPEMLEEIRGARVLDHGCGDGQYAVALAELGAREVVGFDTNPKWMEGGRALSERRRVRNCRFVSGLEGEPPFDVVVSRNCMEHYPNPGEVLAEILKVLAPGGVCYITFGPLWHAPYGAHMGHVTKVPWVHLLVPERAVMAVRNQWFDDGATRYEEVEGGLNRMTVHKLGGLVSSRAEWIRYDAVWGLRRLRALPVLRELLTNHATVCIRDHRSRTAAGRVSFPAAEAVARTA